ncbi:hypothetical protein BS78_05G052700 [Paspalum vaginatum]|nr:hypothetical protein BS78_05G052700 [Paspalum vaginatum]
MADKRDMQQKLGESSTKIGGGGGAMTGKEDLAVGGGGAMTGTGKKHPAVGGGGAMTGKMPKPEKKPKDKGNLRDPAYKPPFKIGPI